MVAKYATFSIWYSSIVLAIKLNHLPAFCTVGWLEWRSIVPLIIGKIAVRAPLSSVSLEIRITCKAFETFLPVTRLPWMFTLMIRANGVTFVIAGTADSREGVYLILVIIITDGTITAIGTPEGTLFAAETAVGIY